MAGLLDMYFPAEDPMNPANLLPQGLLGPSVLSRMQAHSDAQRARMAGGDYSPSRMDEDAMWLADDVAGGLLGALPGGLMMLGARGASKADDIARLLREGRAAEVTDEMLGALGPNDQARLFELYESGATGMDLPMDEASRMARATEQGFGQGTLFGDEMYHGTRREFPAFDPNAPSATDHGWYGKGAAYLGNQELASEYALGGPDIGNNVLPLHTRGKQFEWPEGQSMFLNAEDAAESSKAVRDLGYDGIDIRLPSTAGPEYAGQLHERLLFDPANIRSRHARFDPRLKNNADLLASMGGLGILGATQFYPYAEPAP